MNAVKLMWATSPSGRTFIMNIVWINQYLEKVGELNRKTYQEILAVNLIAKVLGEGYLGVHTGSDTSYADGEIKFSGGLYAVVEVTEDSDELAEQDASIWLDDRDKNYFQLRDGSGAWRVALSKGARWNNLTKDDFQALVDSMKNEGIQSVHTYDGISKGNSRDTCIRLRITDIDLIDFANDGIYHSFSSESKQFDDSGDPYPIYIEDLLRTDKIQNKVKILVGRAKGTTAFLAVIVGSATPLPARFGMIVARDSAPLRIQHIDLPERLSAIYILDLGAGCAIWYHSETGWGEKRIDFRSLLALLQEINDRDGI